MTQTYATLYKKDNTGKVRTWFMEQDKNLYRVISGIKDSPNSITSMWTIAHGKNEGKANATDDVQQAAKEIAAHYEKKVKEGYTYKLEEIEAAKAALISPMLAHDYMKHKEKLTFPLYCQPKLDGIRCIARADGLWTRTGERIVSCPHIHEALTPFFELHTGLVLDGELYNHHLKDDFNQIASLVRKQSGDPARTRDIIQYHIYDVPSDAAPFSKRKDFLFNSIYCMLSASSAEFIKLIDTVPVSTQADMDDYYGRLISLGYEGQMIRIPDSLYEQKRSKNLLKRKEFQDEEFSIIDVVEGKGNRSGMAGALLFKTAEGKEFTANIIGGFELYKKLFHQKDEYVGKMATVKFFQMTPDGIPRFPVVKTIHEQAKI